ncbi:MAG: BrnA antitoxin family protein [Aestuariivirgaceae bacterium]
MRSRKKTSAAKDTVIEDEDNPEWTEGDFRSAKSQSEFPPEVLAAFPKMRGRPPKAESERKVLTSIRLHPIVLDHYKATGPGWQTRIEEILIEAAFGTRKKPVHSVVPGKRPRTKPKERPKSGRAAKRSRPSSASYKKMPATRGKA